MYYNLNGIPTKNPDNNRYWITQSKGDFIFKEGNLLPEIDELCSELQTILTQKLFKGDEKNYSLLSSLPIWIVNGGISTEVKISKEDFEKFISKRHGDEKFNKLLYYFDFRSLISKLQNSISSTNYLYGEFYRLLNENNFIVSGDSSSDSDIRFSTGPMVTAIFSIINSLFINLYCQLDYMTKICYEFEHMAGSFKNYPVLKSEQIFFSEQHKISLSGKKHTIYEKSELINQIITIRDETINNISFNNTPKVYLLFDGKKVVEKYILLPDMKNGKIKVFKNRKYFYSDHNKLNEILPFLITGFWQYLKTTLGEIKAREMV